VPNSTLVYQPSAYFTVESTGLIDPDGAAVSQLTATAFGGQSRTEVTGALANVTTFYSVWVKLKEGNTPPAFLHLVVGDGPKAGFNTSTWSITNGGGGVGSVEYGNDGWVKLKLTFQPNLTTSISYKLVATDTNNYGLTVTAGRVFYVGSKNVSRNSFNHIQTTGTPFYAPRFDHDPVGRTNLTVRSDDFGASEWNQGGTSRNLTVNANNTASPSGATDADLLTVGATTTIYQVAQALPATGNVTSGTAYTVSCYFKPNQVTRVSIWAGNPTTLPVDAMFDLTGAGSVIASAFGTASIQQVGNGWYRCIVTGTAGATSNTSLRFSPVSGTSRNYEGNAMDSFWAWGAQLEAGSTATSYIPTTTAPVTIRDCKGLLIEEGRENFIINSDLYSSATPTNITATTITDTSVTGSSQIRELSLTGTGVSTGLQFDATGTGTVSKTLSVFIKKPVSNAAPYFTIGFASSASQYAGIQLTMSGTIPVVSVTSTANTFSVVSSAIQAFPNNWYRVSVVVSGTAASCFPTMYPSNAVWDGISDIRQTLVASGTNLIYICGAQLEAGGFPTSYIPTTTTAARAADVCSITGDAFSGLYNQSEGTLLVNAEEFRRGSSYTPIVRIANSANFGNNRYQIGTNGNKTGILSLLEFIVQSNSSIVYQATPSPSYPVSFKAALAYSVDNMRGSLNGILTIADDVPSPLITGGNTFTISSVGGYISAVRYYRKRLPDAKLQTLTV
jgi:hypothetical protein